jgi:hypothetical protein
MAEIYQEIGDRIMTRLTNDATNAFAAAHDARNAALDAVIDTARKDFEMTQADLDGILAAISRAQSAPLIMLQCGMPRSIQEAANGAWNELGGRMGFVGNSAKPNGKGDLFFSSEPVQS